MIHERDYTNLSDEEIKQIEKAYSLYWNKGVMTSHQLTKFHETVPKSFYFNDSLFPNNYLMPDLLDNKKELDRIENDFKILLNNKTTTERGILNFINTNENYNLIASLFHTGYDFGHHEAFLFKEFELTSTYRADFLLIGRASNGYEFIFIELESPYGQVTNKNGEFGTVFRKGVKQVEDWDSWIEGNFNSLKLIFDKYKNPNKLLPDEFIRLDKSRLNYIVIAGRRIDFNDKTYELKRKYLKRNNIKILHYDNIFKSFDYLKTAKNY